LRISLFEVVALVNETAAYPSVLAAWGSRAPLLSLAPEHEERGEKCLRELGVPEGAWFVCVHSREGGYSPHDEHVHAYRNSAISDYVLAMEAIVERGGWCVRMGDSTMAPLPAMPGVVDYAHSSLKSDWMDVFLCARSRFFLGNTSGLYLVSTIFGVPSALANLTPLSSAYPHGAFDIGIPKLLKRTSGEEVSFAEALASPVGDFRWAELYRENGLLTINNSPIEIRDLVVEMLSRLESGGRYCEDEERLQDAFRVLYRPRHYAYGAASRIGNAFLAKYAHLIRA
jgi:putative glycosyltransferase (TIGR04372 family)